MASPPRRLERPPATYSRRRRRRARLSNALERLADGGAATTAAFDVGYETVSACIGAFRIAFGGTPARCADASLSRSRAAKHALDAVIIPSLTWRQFRATATEPLGFFGVVARERDRPQQPTEDDLKVLGANPAIEAFIRV